MMSLLVELAQPSSQVFSVGCDLGTALLGEEEFPYTAGGYIQIMSAAYAERSPKDYARFAEAVAAVLTTASQDHEWRVYFVLKPVMFKLDGFSAMTGSLWIWFHAFADGGERVLISREVLVTQLRGALTSDSLTSLLTGSGLSPA